MTIVEIPLSRGYVALIDAEDLHLVDGKTWHAFMNHDRGVYAATNNKVSVSPRKYSTVFMHRLIVGATKEQVVDHINRNPLDNRRCNLRVATRSTNAANSKHRADRSTSPYRGVYSKGSKYVAQVRVNGKLHHLGNYKCPKEAALAYDYAAASHFGEFAVKNNPFEEDRRDLI
jgi:hypothetical protein